MSIQRAQVVDVLLTAAMIGVGFLTGDQVIGGVVSSIGVRWAADLTRQGWIHVRRRWLGESGLLNHDLQQALARAFRRAIAHLEQAWWQTHRGSQIHREEPEAARAAQEAFKLLREDAGKFCAPDRLGRAADNAQVRQLLYGDEAAARQALSEHLQVYLHGHDPQLVAFIEAHLVRELAFWFGEELKADRPESNRAWRAFQRLLLEGLQVALAELRAEQQEMAQVLRELQAWAQRMEARPAEERETTGQAALEQALAAVRDELLEAIARESALTRAAIEAGVEQIARLMRVELERLRQELLSSLQAHGLAEGAPPLPVDLRRYFDRLLRDYALFGGRADALAAIGKFLADPQGGYLFVTGASGYGKTALLAQLAGRDEAAYHFIHRGYGAADEDFCLRNLCQQLAARHGLGGRLPEATTELRVLYPALLRLPPADGRPVVVLLDGLDEALGWDPGPQLFPPDLPDGVKVIFSARPVADRDWPRHLGLPPERVRRLELGAMAAGDVAALLRAAGGAAARLAEDAAWIGQALRVSEGDPFYLKLLVEDVRDGRMRPEQIGAQPAGLDEYLRKWWDQVAAAVRQEQDVRDVLGSLAVARGRLRRDDLVALFPDLGWGLDGVLTEVRRFVIGDEHEGYALCHPRFADYVRRRVGPALQTYTEALLAYCARWREHGSPYALAHYAGHLHEARRYDELYTLVEERAWMEAQFAHWGHYREFLGSVHLAWQAAEAAGPGMVGRQVRYALLQASINSLAGNIPAELLVALVRAGIWSGEVALAYARQVPDAGQRAEALTQLGALLQEQGKQEQGKEVLAEALAAARAIGAEGARARALAGLAQLPPAALHPLWCETLRALAARPRKHLLADLRALVPVVVALGGAPAVAETARAIQEVGQWWP